jgi:hypothetical protein
MKRYRLTFEVVGQQYLRLYSNADPSYYKHTTQTVPNSEIPDEHWHTVHRELDDGQDLAALRDQCMRLKAWHDADKQFVRNPRIEEQTTSEWTGGAPAVSTNPGLARVRSLDSAATPGPWFARNGGVSDAGMEPLRGEANAVLIAAMRNAWPSVTTLVEHSLDVGCSYTTLTRDALAVLDSLGETP